MKILTLTDTQYDDLIGILDDHMSGLYNERNVRLRGWDRHKDLFTALDARVEPKSVEWWDWPTLVKLDERSPSRPIE